MLENILHSFFKKVGIHILKYFTCFQYTIIVIIISISCLSNILLVFKTHNPAKNHLIILIITILPETIKNIGVFIVL